MTERKYLEKANIKKEFLKDTDFPKSSYYHLYLSKERNLLVKKRGRRDNNLIFGEREKRYFNKEELLNNHIIPILCSEFVSYGYQKLTKILKNKGFLINKKRLYRILKEENLLNPKRIKTGYVSFIKAKYFIPDKPNQLWEADYKYAYIRGQLRYARIFNIVDCFTRKLLLQLVGYSLPSSTIVPYIERLLIEIDAKGVRIRTDNGPEFRSYRFKELLEKYKVVHESIHIKHPEENSYIESYHSILETEVLSKQAFESLEELKDILRRWKYFYNQVRIHSSISYKTPVEYEEEFYNNALAKCQLVLV
jgi:putative transposase